MSSVLIRDTGFVEDEWSEENHGRVIIAAADISDHGMLTDNRTYGLDVPGSLDPDSIVELFKYVKLIRIDFSSFADGRGFSIAHRLRELGFEGTLRARGHLIADQYALARRSGFDEVEIDTELAKRQPEEQWINHADVSATTYQQRLKVWQAGSATSGT